MLLEFESRFACAATRGLSFNRRALGLQPIPTITAAEVLGGRREVARYVGRFQETWGGHKLNQLACDVQAEAVACGLASSPPGVVIATRTLLCWPQIEEAARTHCPLYAGLDASEVRKDIRRLAELDPDNCPIRFPPQGGQPQIDYQRFIAWLAAVSGNLGLR